MVDVDATACPMEVHRTDIHLLRHPVDDPVAERRPELGDGEEQPGPGGDDEFRLPPLAGPEDAAGQPVGVDPGQRHAAAGLAGFGGRLAALRL